MISRIYVVVAIIVFSPPQLSAQRENEKPLILFSIIQSPPLFSRLIMTRIGLLVLSYYCAPAHRALEKYTVIAFKISGRWT